MKLVSSMLVLLAGLFSACSPRQQADYFTPVAESQLRAPAYPLVSIDPYTSGWSFTDQLNADQTPPLDGKTVSAAGCSAGRWYVLSFYGKREYPATHRVAYCPGGEVGGYLYGKETGRKLV